MNSSICTRLPYFLLAAITFLSCSGDDNPASATPDPRVDLQKYGDLFPFVSNGDTIIFDFYGSDEDMYDQYYATGSVRWQRLGSTRDTTGTTTTIQQSFQGTQVHVRMFHQVLDTLSLSTGTDSVTVFEALDSTLTIKFPFYSPTDRWGTKSFSMKRYVASTTPGEVFKDTIRDGVQATVVWVQREAGLLKLHYSHFWMYGGLKSQLTRR